MYKLLTSTSDEYEEGFVRDKKRDSQLKVGQMASQRSHMCIMIELKDLFGFIKDLEKIKYGIGFKLILKGNSNDRALFRVIAGAGAVANDCNIEIRDIVWCVPCIDPSNDNRILLQNGLSRKNFLDFSFYERKKLFTRMYKMVLTSCLI